MLGAYFLIYSFSCYGGVDGYMENSLDHLCLQFWSASVFILAMFLLPTSTDSTSK
jgi:hypothetical protein